MLHFPFDTPELIICPICLTLVLLGIASFLGKALDLIYTYTPEIYPTPNRTSRFFLCSACAGLNPIYDGRQLWA